MHIIDASKLIQNFVNLVQRYVNINWIIYKFKIMIGTVEIPARQVTITSF